MTHASLAVVIGLDYAIAVIVFLALVIGSWKAAVEGDDIARGMLGPASSESDPGDDDFALSVASAMYDYSIYGRWHP